MHLIFLEIGAQGIIYYTQKIMDDRSMNIVCIKEYTLDPKRHRSTFQSLMVCTVFLSLQSLQSFQSF